MNADLSAIVQNLGPLFGVIILGALFRGLGILPAEAAPLISRVVMTLTLPALVFTSIRRAGASNLTVGLDLLKMPLLAYIVIAACGALAWGRPPPAPRRGPRRAPSSSPPCSAAPPSSATPSSTRSCRPTASAPRVPSPMCSTARSARWSRWSPSACSSRSLYGEGEKLGWRSLLSVPRAAPFIALMIGLLFYNDPLPAVITDLMKLMGSATSFLMMLYLGMSIAGSGVQAYLRPILASQAIKLIAAPLLAVALAFRVRHEPGPGEQSR